MKVSAKDWLVILIGILVASWIPFLPSFVGVNFGENNYSDWILFFVIVVSSIVFVVYKRIGEIEENVEDINEKLKTSAELNSIKVDIKNIYWILKHGKKK